LAGEWRKHVAIIAEQNTYLEINEAEVTADLMSKPLDIPGNLEKLKAWLFLLIESVLQDLHACPRPVWEFARIFTEYTNLDIFQFLFVNFFALALDDPVSYQLIDKNPPRQAQRTLSILSSMMLVLGNADGGSDFDTIKHSDLITQSYKQRLIQIVEDWTLSVPEKQDTDSEQKISWKVERDALMDLTDYILENQDFIDQELRPLNVVHHNVTFGIGELLESLNPPASVPIVKKTKSRNAGKDTSSLVALISPRAKPSPDTKRKNLLKRKKRDKDTQ